jgi:hypothetical protein
MIYIAAKFILIKMNLFTELLLLFIFIYIFVFMEFPNTKNDSYIFQKFALFVLLFCFYFIIQIFNKLKEGTKINVRRLLTNCLVVATSGVLGYTVLIDMKYMSSTSSFIEQFEASTCSEYVWSFIVSLSIISFITIIKVLGMLFST